MANNRLYISNTENGERILLAKGWGGGGWRIWEPEKLAEWLANKNIDTNNDYDGAPTKLVLVTD